MTNILKFSSRVYQYSITLLWCWSQGSVDDRQRPPGAFPACASEENSGMVK